MKKSRFGIVMLLAFALFFTACAGGGDNATTEAAGTDAAGTEAAGTPAEGLTGSITVQAEEAWVPYYEEAIARVKEANPDATIEIIQDGAFDHLDKIDATGVTNEDIADVFALPADRIYGLAANDALAPIDSQTLAANIGGWDNFDEGIGGNFNIDGDYLAFPYNIESLIVFANKANAEAQGIDIANPVEVNDITDGDQVLLPFFDAWYGVAATNAGNIELLGKNEDGSLFTDMTEEYSALPAEKKDVIDSLYEYWKKHNEKGSSLFDADAGWGYIDNAFTSGNAGVLRLGGPWDTAAISALANDGADLEILPISSITLAGHPLKHWQGGWGLGLNARIEGDEEKTALATALIQEIVNPEHAVALFQATGKVLENVDASVYQDSDLSDVDKAVIAATIESYNESPARPLFTEWGPVWDTWKNGVLSWNSNPLNGPEDAYNLLKASFEAMMANNQ